MDLKIDSDRFPRASAYNPDWILAGASGGANALCLTEWLSEGLDLRPGMKVLDLGCGRAQSSIFLHREFDVQVWAVDLWFDPGENLKRIEDAGAGGSVFPLRADARSLPFAAGFFDVIVSVDSFCYYGTDESFLGSLVKSLKPGGQLGITGSGLTQEFGDSTPPHLAEWWNSERPSGLHSASWWKSHWERSGAVEVSVFDTMPDGWKLWADWLKLIAPENETEIRTLEADAGQYLGYIRTIARKGSDAPIFDSAFSIPANYAWHPMFRNEAEE